MGYKLLGLMIAGACGTLARYGLAGLLQRGSGTSVFPWGTLAVNLLGCFLFGVVWTLTQQRWMISAETRTMVLVGFLGAFTTFSTLVFETDQMLEQAQWAMAGLNLAGSIGLGIVAYLLGSFLGRLI
jgi:CrcB protein